VSAPPVAPPVALTIAGSDPSGGAGVQADLKTFSALGVYGCAVLTALTVQNTQGVTGTHHVPAGFVTDQLDTLVADVELDAVKIGMLATADVAAAVRRFLESASVPVVVLDPVMVASIVTPNTAEAAVLLDTAVATDVPTMTRQAAALRDAGAVRVLLTGGHLTGPDAVDVYAGPEGELRLTTPRVATRNTHGTGGTLSSAIAALRPQRGSWPEAVGDAKDYLTGAIAAAGALRVGNGHGHGPVHHFHRQWVTR